MSWFKVDDGLHASRKLLSIPKRARFAAVGLWTIAGSWSADQLTDGTIPDYMLEVFGAPPSAPQALVDAGLWEREQGSYVFRNWHEYQPSKQDVDAERAASRERMRELRARRKQPKQPEQREEGEAFGRTGPNGSESVRNPDPTQSRPDPTQSLIREDAKPPVADAPAPATPPGFDEFWANYPIKRDKKKALVAYKKALKDADAEQIRDGANRYREDPNREEAFTKHPTTWLNAGGWEDEPLPPRSRTGSEQRLAVGLDLTQRAMSRAQIDDNPWKELTT